ncbi:MAG: hypothetical protein ACRC6H_03885 [Culicoidibacterales bacterium]
MIGEIIGIYVLAYVLMLPLAAIHVLFNWLVLGYAGYTSVAQLRAQGPRVEAYVKTQPWQPLYNLLVFLPLCWFLLPEATPITLVIVGSIWIGLSIALDTLCWVLMPHPWQLSLRELFVDHQPWITLCYLATALCPFIVLLKTG